jgi:predicted transcriptional regulator
MAKQPVERRHTSWRISIEAKRLLELLAQKAGTSQSAVFEQAIREKARREKVTLDGEPLVGASRQDTTPAATPEERVAAMERFRQLVAKARTHDTGELTPEEIEHEVALAIAEVRKSAAMVASAVRSATEGGREVRLADL